MNETPWLSLEAIDTAKVLSEAAEFAGEMRRKVAAEHEQSGRWGFIGSTYKYCEMDTTFGEACIVAAVGSSLFERFCTA